MLMYSFIGLTKSFSFFVLVEGVVLRNEKLYRELFFGLTSTLIFTFEGFLLNYMAEVGVRRRL